MTLPAPPSGISDLANAHVPPPDVRRLATSIGPLHDWGLVQGQRLAQLGSDELTALGNEALDVLVQHGHLTGPERQELGRLADLDHGAGPEKAMDIVSEVHAGLGPDASPAAIILASVAHDSAQAHSARPTLWRVVAYDFIGAAVGGAVGGLGGPVGVVLGAAVGALGASAYAEMTGG